MDQYSELHSTSHALVEEAADARALAMRLEEEIAQMASLQARQQRLNKDMQHLVIGTRMAGSRRARVAAASQLCARPARRPKGGRARHRGGRNADRQRRAEPAGRAAAAPSAQRGRSWPGNAARASRPGQGRGRPDRAELLAPGTAGRAALPGRRPRPGPAGDPEAGGRARTARRRSGR